MSTLREVGESRTRLAEKHREPQGATGSRRFTVTYVITDGQGRSRAFVRASLRELGFMESPRWGAVMKRVRKLGRLCRKGDASLLQAKLSELADVFRPVMRPSKGQIAVCHGGGILMHSAQEPFHRLMLDTEVVFEKAA